MWRRLWHTRVRIIFVLNVKMLRCRYRTHPMTKNKQGNIYLLIRNIAVRTYQTFLLRIELLRQSFVAVAVVVVVFSILFGSATNLYLYLSPMHLWYVYSSEIEQRILLTNKRTTNKPKKKKVIARASTTIFTYIEIRQCIEMMERCPFFGLRVQSAHNVQRTQTFRLHDGRHHVIYCYRHRTMAPQID